MAQGFYLSSLYTSAPFGFGAGLVNPSRALDPDLVFSAGYEDYISFLCSLPNIDSAIVKTATGGVCGQLFDNPSDLNLPSITITSLTVSDSHKCCKQSRDIFKCSATTKRSDG